MLMSRRARAPMILLVLVGCAEPSALGDAGSAADAGSAHRDGAVVDDGGGGRDASRDAGAGAGDGGTTAEVCSGGLDEDGDGTTDCDDSDCFLVTSCIASDVAMHEGPGLTECGDPITIDAADSASACATIGTPAMSTYATDCTTGSLVATARVFCDASGVPAALWLHEILTTPVSQQMLTPRSFRHVAWERESVLDWESVLSGGSGHSGGAELPVRESASNTSANDERTVISVRSVAPGDVVSRLLGMFRISSLIDLDAPMSMDTREAFRLGGVIVTIPTP